MAAIRTAADRQRRRRVLRRYAARGLAVIVSLVAIAHGGGVRKEP